MKKSFLLMAIAAVLFMGTPSSGLANTVSVYLDGIDAAGLEIGGFQLMLSESFNLPPGTVEGQPPPTFGNNFFINGIRATGSTSPGLASDQPYSGEYWEVNTLIDPDDTDGAEYVRGVYGFDNYWDASWNKLNDGLLLTLSSSLSIAIDIVSPGTFFYDYNDEIIDGLQISCLWEGGNQTVNVSAVPIPSTLLLLGGGLAGLLGLKRRKRS
jgi:hypothetical protein